MKKNLTHLFVDFIMGAAIIMLMSYFFEGVYVKNFTVAFLVAIVLSLLNTFIKPILTLIALPITIMSLGIFQLIINGFILTLATDILRPDFYIHGFGLTIVVSVLISFFYSVLGIGKDD